MPLSRWAVSAAMLLFSAGLLLASDEVPLRLISSFDATDLRSVRIDEGIAAGPANLVLTNNDSVTIRRKNGTVVATRRLADFFAGQAQRGEFVGDVRVLYDPYDGRFFISAHGHLNQSQPCPIGSCIGHFFVAISKNASPESLVERDWMFYALDATTSNGTPTSLRPDFTSLGVTADAVAITTRMFPFGGGSTAGLKIRVLNKGTLLQAGPAQWVDFSTFSSSVSTRAMFQPAYHFGDTGTFFVVGYIAGACGFAIIGIENAATDPTVSTQLLVSNRPCSTAPNVPQPGQSPLLSNISVMGTRPVYRNGSLWVARTVEHRTASGIVSALQWSEIDVSRWPEPPSFVQQGVLAFDDAFLIYPALAVNDDGNMAMVFGRSSTSEYASLYFTGRLASDPADTLRPAVLLKAGEASLNGSTDPGRGNSIPFGDYFEAAVDQVDSSVWILGEYVRSETTIGRWAGHISFPEASGRLLPGARLRAGQLLRSANGRYRLVYQRDGNLVLYDDVERVALWSAGTGGTTPGQAVMQADGTFVVIDGLGTQHFATATTSNANAFLMVQDDGNLVVSRSDGTPLWTRLD